MSEPKKEQQPASTMTPEQLEEARQTTPAANPEKSFWDEEEENMWRGVNRTIGIGDEPPSKTGFDFSVLARTYFKNDREADTFADLIQRAEHGIGGPLDRPSGALAGWAMKKLLARVSIEGKSLERLKEMISGWVKTVEAREARLKEQQQARTVGA